LGYISLPECDGVSSTTFM